MDHQIGTTKKLRVHKDQLQAPPHVQDFDWDTWQAGIKATLVFVHQADQVLLIEKKTGLGKGKINAPGGKVEAGESWQACAQRELLEEVNLHVDVITHMATLRFLMSDYADIECHVFFTNDFKGIAQESPEARPFWCPKDQIPFHLMWEDDQYWLPRALAGERLDCYFSFLGEKMCSHHIKTLM